MNLNNPIQCCAVILAAGASTRMNLPIGKQFFPILGMPSVARTISAFEKADEIGSIVIVCREDDFEQMKIIARGIGAKKIAAVVPGGETRQQSAAAGLTAVPKDAEFVAVHDGARPLVRPEEIDACVADAREYGASALAVPVKDTIKITDEAGFVASTPERSYLWAVQTPQVFRRSDYEAAMRGALGENADYTDDCQLLEHAGVKVHLCRGSYENIKLTTQDDIVAAEAILRRREESV
jgi:2-C-methyl-D-erythritol 4-phosphate cytidylyltransferase